MGAGSWMPRSSAIPRASPWVELKKETPPRRVTDHILYPLLPLSQGFVPVTHFVLIHPRVEGHLCLMRSSTYFGS